MCLNVIHLLCPTEPSVNTVLNHLRPTRSTSTNIRNHCLDRPGHGLVRCGLTPSRPSRCWQSGRRFGAWSPTAAAAPCWRPRTGSDCRPPAWGPAHTHTHTQAAGQNRRRPRTSGLQHDHTHSSLKVWSLVLWYGFSLQTAPATLTGGQRGRREAPCTHGSVSGADGGGSVTSAAAALSWNRLSVSPSRTANTSSQCSSSCTITDNSLETDSAFVS